VSHGEAGFLLGSLPGAVLVLRTMWYGRSLQKRVEAVAWKERAWNDTQLSHTQQLMLLTNPEHYIAPSDTPEMVKVKREVLAALPGFHLRALICGAIMFAGAAIGAIAGSFVG